MPYTARQEHLLRAIEHGFKPSHAMKNVSKSKAAKMLSHDNNKMKRGSHMLAKG